MVETIEILRGKLKRWQKYMTMLGEAADQIAKSKAKEPHPIGWVNIWVDQAEVYREILRDFCECTGLGILESTAFSSDEMVLDVQVAGLTRWIQHWNRRWAGAALDALNAPRRLTTPELKSKNAALAGCYAVASTSFFDMTGLREPQINPLMPEDGVVGYDEFIDHRCAGHSEEIKEFCVTFKRTVQELREAADAMDREEGPTPEQQAVLNDYSRYRATLDIKEAEASLVGIEQDPEMSVEAEALLAAMEEQLPDMDVDLGDLRTRALDLAERWKATRG